MPDDDEAQVSIAVGAIFDLAVAVAQSIERGKKLQEASEALNRLDKKGLRISADEKLERITEIMDNLARQSGVFCEPTRTVH